MIPTIESLPPLPEARIESYQVNSAMHTTTLHTYSSFDMREYALTAVLADRAARVEPDAPDGWVLAPKEPTAAMLAAFSSYSKDQLSADYVYRTMLAAAPSAAAPSILKVAEPAATAQKAAQERRAKELDAWIEIYNSRGAKRADEASAEPVQAPTEQAREVPRELVALKDLSDSIAALQTTQIERDPVMGPRYQDYLRRRYPAWAAARALLTQPTGKGSQ